MLSLLVFGVDETLDPARSRCSPCGLASCMPGLFVAGSDRQSRDRHGAGLPRSGGHLVARRAAVAARWSRSRSASSPASCCPAPATAAFASFLGSRRFRDLAFVALAVLGSGIGLGGNLFGGLAAAGADQLRGVLADAAAVLGWTPFGWAWAIPGRRRSGQWLAAALHLILALALVALLWRGWEHFLAQRLTEPLGSVARGRPERSGGLADRLYPATPAGGVAMRTLRYWRRDPRYLAGISGFAIAPVILIVPQLVNPDSGPPARRFAPRCWAGCSGWASPRTSATTAAPSGCTPLPGLAAPTTGPDG